MRCFQCRFVSSEAASLGFKRCHGGSIVNGILWKRCRYLKRCLGMPVREWQRRRARIIK